MLWYMVNTLLLIMIVVGSGVMLLVQFWITILSLVISPWFGVCVVLVFLLMDFGLMTYVSVMTRGM